MSQPVQIEREQMTEFRTLLGLSMPIAAAQLGFMTMGVIDTTVSSVPGASAAGKHKPQSKVRYFRRTVH